MPAMQEKPADWDERYEWPYDRSRRVCMKILGDPNPVVRALGLDITLPNPHSPDAKWERKPSGWKAALRGRIADICEARGDTEWALLLAPEWGRVVRCGRGVVVYFPVEHISKALSLLATLRAHEVPLVFPDGTPHVWVMPVAMGDNAAPEVVAGIEEAGFMPDERRLIWTPAAA